MDLLMHNPIADMYGPHFLWVYGCVVVATFLLCLLGVRAADVTRDLPPVPLSRDPDPYEIAYLRGGENEVIRLVIFDLIQRGYLKIIESDKWLGKTEQRLSQASKCPDDRHLTPLERKVFEIFSSPRTAAQIFQTDLRSHELEWLTDDYEKKFQKQRILNPPEIVATARYIFFLSAVLVLGLGGYKLIVALMKGRTNVEFLVLMGVCSFYALKWACRPPRLSRLGQDYLKRLQGVFERMKSKASKRTTEAPDTTRLMLVALFGVGVLTGTSYAYLDQLFKKSASSGGSWDSGGGCSGGGGGCGGGGGGGGGCGGCGGGD